MSPNLSVRIAALAALLLVPAAISTARADDKPNAAALLADFNKAYEAKDYKKAIEIGEKLVEANDDGGVNSYNLACVFSLSGDQEKALKALETSAKHGFSDVEQFTSDPDLAGLPKKLEYLNVMKAMNDNQKKELAELDKQIADSKPLVILPKNYDAAKPAPVIFALHGFGQKAEDIADVWKAVAEEKGAILVAPRAVTPAGGGFQWGSPAKAARIVEKAWELVSKDHKIDAQRSVLTGFSQGGFIAYCLAPKHADKFHGIIPVAGGYIASRSKPKNGAGAAPRYYIMVGANDRTLETNRAAAKDLEKAGVKVKLAEFEGVGHEFPKERDAELKKALEWVWSAEKS